MLKVQSSCLGRRIQALLLPDITSYGQTLPWNIAQHGPIYQASFARPCADFAPISRDGGHVAVSTPSKKPGFSYFSEGVYIFTRPCGLTIG